MTKIILTLIAVIISAAAFSQSFNIGPRAGISQSYLKVEETIDNVKYSTGDPLVGFHAGAFARIGFSSLYIQPELLFTSAGGTINLNDPNKEDVKINYNRIDVPVMFGLKASAFRVNLGPVASFNIDSKNKSISEIGNEIKSKYKMATFGYQAGIGLDIWKLVIDAKYESSFSSICNDISIDGNNYKFDQRGQQFILSVGFKIL